MIKLLNPVNSAIWPFNKFGAHPESYRKWGFAGHEGVDFMVPSGTLVRACVSGVVTKINLYLSHPYGIHARVMSVIDGRSVEVVYCHLSKLAVRAGQTVNMGQEIGRSGNTGNTGGDPHLHLTVKVSGMQTKGYPAGVVDPEPYLAAGTIEVTPEPADPTSWIGIETSRVIDLSHYDKNVNYALLAAVGVIAVIIKNDDMAEIHTAGVRSAGMLAGLYDWVDVTRDGVTQADEFLEVIGRLKPDFIAGDAEQDWADWNAWNAWRAGKIPWSAVPKASQKQIARVHRDYFAKMRAGTRLWTLLYTRVTFIAAYLADESWVNDLDGWFAQYGRKNGVRRVTWAELERLEPKNEPDGWKGRSPVLRQWSGDEFYIDGLSIPGDFNLFRGTREDLLKKCGLAEWPKVVAVPWLTGRLAAGVAGLNVRQGASADTKSLRVFLPGQPPLRIDPDLKSGAWRKLWNEPGWVHSGYLTIT